MSNLWAALLASDRGRYKMDGTTVSVLDEGRFDYWAGKGPFSLVGFHDGKPVDGGVLWVTLKGNRQVEQVRRFYNPPTVMYRKGARAVALWAIEPLSPGWVWDCNEKLARLFKGKVGDGDPERFRLDIRGMSQEWRMDALYKSDELVGRIA